MNTSGSGSRRPASKEEVARFRFGDADEVRDDIGDQAELLDAVVPLNTDVDHPEGVCVRPSVQSIDHEI